MLHTRTGNFPIGIRQGWTDWQKDWPTLLAWAKENGLGVIDIGRNSDEIAAISAAGLQVGTMDLLVWQALMSSDDAQRADAVAKNSDFIEKAAQAGARKFFTVMLPANPQLKRTENFGYMVESLQKLTPVLEKNDAQMVIEGYPGDGALCCTPESYRATFRECPSLAIGINYDPSHLLRMGIDPLRFLKEFAPRVGHVHGKDAEILADDLYEYGWEQPATFKENPAFGASAWRYTIPGQGMTNWSEVFRILAANNYAGKVCIELEDRDFNGSDDGEKLGFVAGATYLSHC